MQSLYVCGTLFLTVNAYNQHRRSFYLRGLVVLHCQSRPELMLLLLRVRTCPLQQYSGFRPNGRAVQRIWITFAYLAYSTYSVLVKKSQNGPYRCGKARFEIFCFKYRICWNMLKYAMAFRIRCIARPLDRSPLYCCSGHVRTRTSNNIHSGLLWQCKTTSSA